MKSDIAPPLQNMEALPATREGLLPTGLSEAEFSLAVGEFVEALGVAGVATADDNLDGFVDPHALPDEQGVRVSAVLSPASVTQVQAIVRIANKYRIPLWTFSGGRNTGYGMSAPRVTGSVLVNLRRMNRVLEINEECAYAVVEPGVSFFDLHEHLRAGGYKLMMSVPDLGWGSVIGNTLEYGFGYTSHGDHAMYQCGMEVVLANGDIIRTGMGAMNNSDAWHVYKKGFGPSVDGLFMQSNFGIVTRMGIWLMPRPQRYLSCFVQCEREEDLEQLIDVTRPFLLDRTIPNNPVVSDLSSAASLVTAGNEWFDGPGSIPDDVLERLIRETGLGKWNMRFALYGSDAVVEAQLAMVRQAFSCIEGARFTYREYDGCAPEDAVHAADKTQAGIPGCDILQMTRWRGRSSTGYVGFAPVTRLIGSEVAAQYRLTGKGIAKFGLGHSCAYVLFPRSAVHVGFILFDKNDM